MSDSNRKSSGAWCASFGRFMGGTALLMAAAAASAQSVVIQARGTLAYNGGPVMQLRVNNTLVGSVEVRSAVFTDYAFDAGAVPAGAKVEVIFNNDDCCSSGDRNLYVQSIRLNGAVVTPTDPGVLFEPGHGDAALDGTGTRSGLSGMLWNGALRFYAPAISSGPTYYFSDCQTGAAIGCLPGNNAYPGTQAAPKQDLTGINVNALPAGSQLLFNRGGAWDNFQAQIANYNVTPTQPLVFDAYGSGAAPWLKAGSGGIIFNFSQWGVTTIDGGYTVRNLRLDGQGVATTAITQGNGTTHVLMENLNIHNFTIGLALNDGARFLTLRNSIIRNNIQHGMLGAGDDWVIEGNTFEGNGDARPPSTHAIYFSAGITTPAQRLTVRNNVFRNNSQQGGACRSGNMTVHGRIDTALIENNAIESATYGPGCRGISIAAGYSAPEFMRNFTVRNNSVRNAGACVAFSAAPGIVIDSNTCVDNTANVYPLIETVSNNSGGADDADVGAVVRNNILCGTNALGSGLISVRNAASVVGNTIRIGSDASTGVCAR